MPQSKEYNFRRWFLLGFALFSLLLNAGVYILYEKNQQVNQSKLWVTHTYDVINEANLLFFSLQDMSIAQRGYLLTGNEAFLVPYHQSTKTLQEHFSRIFVATKDNQRRIKQLEILKVIFDEHRQLMDEQIALRRLGKYDPSQIDASKSIMDQVRHYRTDLLEDEQKLLDRRIAQDNARQYNYFRTIFITAGISILGLLIANAVIGFLSIRRLDAEDDLRRTNQEMEGFTYIASHDLRSPLVNLRGFSSEMSMGIKELQPIFEKAMPNLSIEEQKQAKLIMETDIPDALRFIHSSVERMDRLTNAILELSRIGKRAMKIQPLNVKSLVERIIGALQYQLTQKNVTIKLHPIPEVMSDPLSLEQVFGNLLDNAVKYLDPDRPGLIEVGGSKGKRHTTYWVKDNGRGISENDMQKIFEIYRRAGNNKDILGEGMGMAYVRTTLRRLGGKIWCESTPGTGSIFYFTVENATPPKEGKKNA